jgi:hypothetical protein
MNNNFNENLLIQDVQMDASVNFRLNGDINIYPCPWEDGKQVTKSESVRYRGGIKVCADGRTSVKRYNDGMNGPKLDTLFETAHGSVKINRPMYRRTSDKKHKAGVRRLDREFVHVTFKFPKKFGMALIKALYKDETDEIMSFFMTRKVETIWKQD